MPIVSVIIPTYNGSRFIIQAINSVLTQTYRNFEIIVVDDGSKDDTFEVLRPHLDRITYIYQTNRKLPSARNTGIAASCGDYLAFLDSDDTFLPDKLTIQSRFLNERPEVGLVASGYQYIDEAGQVLHKSSPEIGKTDITLESILFGGLAPVHATLLRREWFERVGGFDTQFAYCEDMDLWYRLALAGCKMAWEPSIVCQYRLHANNMSRSPEIHFEYLRKALDKAFENPLMPDELAARKSELFAQLYLSEASRLLAGGWETKARECIRHAFSLDQDLMAHDGQRLAELVVDLQSEVWGSGRFESFVLSMLEDKASAVASTFASVTAKKRFYTAFMERNSLEVRRAWMAVTLQEPSWLLNRGGWSILLQSLVRQW